MALPTMSTGQMKRSELIERIAHRQPQLELREVELAVKTILEHMTECLAGGGRVEIRGFGPNPTKVPIPP